MSEIKEALENWAKIWKSEFLGHRRLIVLSIIFLIAAVEVNILASSYVDRTETISVPDLILDHIPILDLDIIFVYGLIIIIFAILFYTLFFKIKEFHIVLSQFSLLILVRSFFVIFTHLARPTGAIVLANLPKIYQIFNFHNDLFFSGHTAIPFLAFLLFRKEKIGIFFLIATIVMAITVLFLHLHYSIDVFAALFITYGSYKIGERFFSKINHY